jgi:glycyl-tRNA synthetase beta chain
VAEFLLEIGCEEIPAGWLASVTAELSQRATGLLSDEHLEPLDVAAHSTPRRLVLRATVQARQPDREEEVWGPALKAAKDAAGNWTKAAEGFAKKGGIELGALRTGAKPGKTGGSEEHLVFRKATAGRAAAEVLPSVIASILRGLSFPKRMSWDAWLDDGKGAFPFGRPIRWMLALLDGAIVPFQIYALVDGARGPVAVETGDRTIGHRFYPRGLGGQPVRVSSFDELRDTLRDRFVLLSHADRASAIEAGLAAVRREVVSDHGLIADWAQLVEHPSVVVGRIPDEFKSLPREVLETVLVHHQKYIPLVADGRTVSRFAAVTDTDASSSATIARGMERVVVARLRDASFFYAEDSKRSLASRVADLAGVTFHQKLGSYKEKADRLVRLVDTMGSEMGLLTKPEHQAARQAALLAKADLTTQMVREFPELQGVMGGIYLRSEGAFSSVAAAVQWHYHPVSVEPDSAPAGRLEAEEAATFAAVSLADKIDTLAGYFGLGLQPTGSSDPFGLRRAAQGAVRVVLDFWRADVAERRPSLRALIPAAIAGYAGTLSRPAAETAGALEAFLIERLRYVLEARGYPADEVEAVLGAREPDALDDPHETLARLAALHKVRSEAADDFAALATAFKRAKNILGQAQPSAVDPALLGEPAERELHAAVAKLAVGTGGHEARLRALATLRGPVDNFFKDVMVMAEDARLRANRLGLLASALDLFYRIADISKLGG